MTQLNVVNANTLSPLLAALPFSETKLETVLESVGLSPTLSESQEGIVALHAAEKMLCISTKLVGHSTFGFASVPFNPPDMDRYSTCQSIKNGATDLDLAFELSRTINGLLTGDRVFGTVRGDLFWLLKTANATEWTGDWAVVQYSLAIFLSGMRKLFGGDLAPAAVMMPCAAKPHTIPDDFHDISVQVGTGLTGLGFRVKDLCVLSKIWRAKSNMIQTDSHVPLSIADKSNLATCAVGFLRGGRSDKLAKRMAASFGMSVRSYQRRLGEIGTTHSELVDNARLELALKMLSEDIYSVTEIAMELGYTYPGHFTRFFKKRVGLPPSEYRLIEMNA